MCLLKPEAFVLLQPWEMCFRNNSLIRSFLEMMVCIGWTPNNLGFRMLCEMFTKTQSTPVAFGSLLYLPKVDGLLRTLKQTFQFVIIQSMDQNSFKIIPSNYTHRGIYFSNFECKSRSLFYNISMYHFKSLPICYYRKHFSLSKQNWILLTEKKFSHSKK